MFKFILQFLKKLIKNFLIIPFYLILFVHQIYSFMLYAFFPKLTGYGFSILNKFNDREKKTIKHQGVDFLLHVPNHLCYFRYSTFSIKEPEFFDWINEYGGGVFYDIGANIGIFSLYYARLHKEKIYSFEPSIFNLKQLAKNININNLDKRISIISNPLADKTGFNIFINSSEEEGGALNAFSASYGMDGKLLESDFKYSVLGFSLDYLVEQKIIKEKPSLIKIDVDGIEHLILKGAQNILKSKALKSIYIEVNDYFKEQSNQVEYILKKSGFILKEKRQSKMATQSIKFSGTFNQIWIRGKNNQIKITQRTPRSLNNN